MGSGAAVLPSRKSFAVRVDVWNIAGDDHRFGSVAIPLDFGRSPDLLSIPTENSTVAAMAPAHCFITETTKYAYRNCEVVQRSEGLWIHPARSGWERRFRPHLRRRTCGPRLAERRPEDQL